MDKEQIQQEVDRNYEYFKSIVGELLLEHAGEYVTIRNREIVCYSKNSEDAAKKAKKRFGDEMYSIQKIDNFVIDLGIYSYA